MTRTPSGRGKRILGMKVAAVLLGLFLGLAMVLALAWKTRDRMSEDAQIYAELHPKLRLNMPVTVRWPEHPSGFLRMNEPYVHYRQPWHVPERKPEDVPRRVLVLGDSHTAGFCERREAFTALMDEQLSPSQVINSGILGCSAVDALRYYRDELDRQEYDDVVYVLYLGNDMSDFFRPGQWQFQRRKNGVYQEIQTHSVPGIAAWKRHLFSLHLLPERFLTHSESRILHYEKMRSVNPGTIDQQSQQDLFFRDHPDKFPEAEAMLEWAVTELDRLAGERGATFTLALLPTRRMVEPEKTKDLAVQVRNAVKLEESDEDTDVRARQVALDIGRRRGVQVLDLTPDLQDLSRRNPKVPVYWRIDFHLSTFGHKVVAETLLRFLKSCA